MNIIGNKKIFLTLSGIFMLASIVAIAVWGLHLGIDFVGGSFLEITFVEERPAIGEARELLREFELGNVVIQPTGERGMIVRFRHVDEETHRKILTALAGGAPVEEVLVEERFDSIGPVIGDEFKRRSFWALLFAIGAIILYIAWAFRHISEPVSSWKYGVVAVAALVHDVLIPTGIFAALGYFLNVELDALFITALLTIMGFSVHDTIVVFDRTRENLRKRRGLEPFATTVNTSVRQTMTRSINTSLTTLFVLMAVFFFGGATTQFFALALIIGILAGTYSSIFFASPLLVVLEELQVRRRKI